MIAPASLSAIAGSTNRVPAIDSMTPTISSSCALSPSEFNPICRSPRQTLPMGAGTASSTPINNAWFMSFTCSARKNFTVCRPSSSAGSMPRVVWLRAVVALSASIIVGSVRPCLRPIATTSRVDSLHPTFIMLFTDFIVCPLPTRSPQWNTFWLMVRSTGRAFSNTSLGPEAMIEMVPATADCMGPDTGASNMEMPDTGEPVGELAGLARDAAGLIDHDRAWRELLGETAGPEDGLLDVRAAGKTEQHDVAAPGELRRRRRCERAQLLECLDRRLVDVEDAERVLAGKMARQGAAHCTQADVSDAHVTLLPGRAGAALRQHPR